VQGSMASSPVTKVTEEEYLAFDRAAEVRSEFVDGEMFAMSGGSLWHSHLAMNIAAELHNSLRGTTCRAFTSDLRVRVMPRRMYAYPDVTVVCGTPVLADERQDILLNPTAVVEVLSPSTEKYDRGVKFQYYRTIESLRDYVLVSQDHVRVEQFTRGEAGTWTLRDYQNLEDQLKIESIGAAVSLALIYDGVELPPFD
jgi:Uma2 family endonuclease